MLNAGDLEFAGGDLPGGFADLRHVTAIHRGASIGFTAYVVVSGSYTPAGWEASVDASAVDLRRRGLRLEYLTVAWNVVEALVAVGAGVAARSIALIGFGLDSLIEVFAAVVVIWELQGVGEDRERRALRLIAWSFFALAAYVVVEAGRDLLTGAEAEQSLVGIALAVASLLVMPALGLAKRATGKRLGSATLLAVVASAGTWMVPTPSPRTGATRQGNP